MEDKSVKRVRVQLSQQGFRQLAVAGVTGILLVQITRELRLNEPKSLVGEFLLLAILMVSWAFGGWLAKRAEGNDPGGLQTDNDLPQLRLLIRDAAVLTVVALGTWPVFHDIWLTIPIAAFAAAHWIGAAGVIAISARRRRLDGSRNQG